MRRSTCAGLALSLCLLLPATRPLAGQASPLALDVRVGAGLPVGGFAEGPLAEGRHTAAASFGLHFDYRTGARSGLYLGFSQHRFGCSEVGCPGDGEYVHTGWDLGTRLSITTGRVRPRFRLGAVFARVERDFHAGGDGGVVRRVSDLSVGAEAGVELAVTLRPRLHLAPGVRYVWLNTRFPDEGLLRMRYLVTDVALILAF